MSVSTSGATPTYEVYAVEYAESAGLPPGRVEIGADPRESPFDMAYYVWLVRGPQGDIVVDTGFNATSGAKRGHRLLRTPGDGLRALDVDLDRVRTVVLTHLHYDHAGNLDLFPRARFHVQEAEVAFATGRHMRQAFFAAMYEPDDIATFVHRVFDGRVVFHDGDAEIEPGVTVHLTSGHTPGVQFVRVWTRAGWLVLASDSCHYTFLRERQLVYPVVFDPAGLIDNYARLSALASGDHLVIPGHDPAVLTGFPAAEGTTGTFAVRLD